MSGCDYCEDNPKLDAALRRDWAVRVLDAWALAGKSRCVELFPGGHGWFYMLKLRVNPIKDEDTFETPFASSTDAARHAAALAVFPSLSDAVRAELGECP